MSDIDQLMRMIAQPAPAPTQRYSVWLTPNGMLAINRVVRHRDINELRLLVQAVGRRHFPRGFSFSVRSI